jgi:CRP-like cAMP-binding protein
LRSSVATSGPAAAPQLGQNLAASGSGSPQTLHALTTDNMFDTLMADHKIAALGKVPLFERLTKKELEFVAREGDEVDVPAGKVLIREGRPGDTFYVILDGEAEVAIGGKRRRVLKAGDFFGEISMLDRGLGTATVTCTEPSRMFVMSHAQFRDAIKGSDALLVKVLMAMGERLRADLALKG